MLRWWPWGALTSINNRKLVLESTRDGIFGASCLLHCGFTLKGPLIDGQDAIRALHSWVQSHISHNGSQTVALRHHYVDKPNHKGKYWPPSGVKCPTDPTLDAAKR